MIFTLIKIYFDNILNILYMAGRIVETKLGKGQTNNNDKPVNGKILVYLTDGRKIICDPKNIKIVGLWD